MAYRLGMRMLILGSILAVHVSANSFATSFMQSKSTVANERQQVRAFYRDMQDAYDALDHEAAVASEYLRQHAQPRRAASSKSPLQSNLLQLETQSEPYFELVLASVCEPLSWIDGFKDPVTIYLKKPDCLEQAREAATKSSKQGRVVELPNVGREGHSYITHILDNWDKLATYTAFTQGGGEHNGIHDMDKIQEFLSLPRNQSMSVVPILHRNKQGMVLYRDADLSDPSPNAGGGIDTATNTYMFGYCKDLDMANRARVMYASLFGGTPCDAPPTVFSAGAQFIVHRDAIRAKPRAFWEHVKQNLADYDAYGYDFERLWLYALDPKVQAAEHLELPITYRPEGCCGKWTSFNCATYNYQEGISDLQKELGPCIEGECLL